VAAAASSKQQAAAASSKQQAASSKQQQRRLPAVIDEAGVISCNSKVLHKGFRTNVFITETQFTSSQLQPQPPPLINWHEPFSPFSTTALHYTPPPP